MTDRAIRNLAHLRRSASTARVLNLLNVYNEYQHDPDWIARPLFRTPALNRSLIIKHRLRRDELDLFRLRRQVATKIVLPIDSSDLRTGGRFVFVGQRHFERMMQEAFGIDREHPDMATLILLDRLPSLDPFLLANSCAETEWNWRPAISRSARPTWSGCCASSRTRSVRWSP